MMIQEHENGFAGNIPKVPSTKLQAMQEIEHERERAFGDPEAIERIAKLIQNDSAALYLSGIAEDSPLAAAPIESLQMYLNAFLDEFLGQEGRRDPLLMTMAEQIILSKHVIARLYCEGLHEKDPEARRVNIQLATSLTGELRRLIKETDTLKERFASRGKASESSKDKAKVA